MRNVYSFRVSPLPRSGLFTSPSRLRPGVRRSPGGDDPEKEPYDTTEVLLVSVTTDQPSRFRNPVLSDFKLKPRRRMIDTLESIQRRTETRSQRSRSTASGVKDRLSQQHSYSPVFTYFTNSGYLIILEVFCSWRLECPKRSSSRTGPL